MTKPEIKQPEPYSLLHNSRFYILCSSLLLSFIILAILRLQLPSDQLFAIRTQQVFGLMCILYWYAALVISPIGHIIGKQRMKKIEFARRAIGVSAFYFAALHAGIALWGQLGGVGSLQQLPQSFQWSLAGGAVALAVLAVMALTSFDRVVKFMTYRKWKWLHRFVYIAGVLAVLHIWSIGTHLAYGGVQLTALIALAVLSGLELFRVTKTLNEKLLHLGKTEAGILFAALWVMVVSCILLLPVMMQNYHSKHTDQGGGHSSVQMTWGEIG